MKAFIIIANNEELICLEKFIIYFKNEINIKNEYVLNILINCINYDLYIEKKYNYIIKCFYYEENIDFKSFIKSISEYDFYYLIKDFKNIQYLPHLNLYYNHELNCYDNENNIISCNYLNFYYNFKKIKNFEEYSEIFEKINNKLILHNPKIVLDVSCKKKIFCKLMGGLGNLLFIICTVINYSIENDCEIYWLIEEKTAENITERKRMNEYVIFKNFEYTNGINFEYEEFNEKSFIYEKIPSFDNNLRIFGYFQSCHYFFEKINEIKKMLYFDNFKDEIQCLYNNLLGKNIFSVSVHIRRGDYLSLSHFHHNQSITYYEKAMNYFNQDGLFFIFSDDIEWCKTQELFLTKNCVFVENLSDEKSLYLMSLCTHNICANSSFSLWGSYLNENDGITIIPCKWFGLEGPIYKITDLIPKNRTYITCNDEETEEYNKIIQFNKKNKIFLNKDKMNEIIKFNTVGIMLICTGKYVGFVKNTIKRINEQFLINHNKIFYIITDNLDFFQDITDKYNIVLKHIYKKGFPNDTLYRYNYFLLVKEHLLNNTQYMFYFDVDMDITDYVFEDILPNINTPLLGTRHPGFIMAVPFPEKCGSPDKNPESTAYIPEEKRIDNYIAGGFNGGITKYFIEMSETIDRNIKIDNENNVVALWHDESHLNNYYTFNEKLFKILQPEYCYPQHLQSNCKPKIIALDKQHNEVRFSDIYLTCDENENFWINLFHIMTILSISLNLNMTPIFTLSCRSELYFNLQYNQHADIQYNISNSIKSIDNKVNTKLDIDFINIKNFIDNKNEILKRFNIESYDIYKKYNIPSNKILYCIHLNENNDYYVKLLNKIQNKNNFYIIIVDNKKTYSFFNQITNFHIIECKNNYDFLCLSNSFKNIVVSNSYNSFWACFLGNNIKNIYILKNFSLLKQFEFLDKKLCYL